MSRLVAALRALFAPKPVRPSIFAPPTIKRERPHWAVITGGKHRCRHPRSDGSPCGVCSDPSSDPDYGF